MIGFSTGYKLSVPSGGRICKVDDCGKHLTHKYCCKHHVCRACRKLPCVYVQGVQVRWCYQCGCFHDVARFHNKNRSCNTKLLLVKSRQRAGVTPEPNNIDAPSTTDSDTGSQDNNHSSPKPLLAQPSTITRLGGPCNVAHLLAASPTVPSTTIPGLSLGLQTRTIPVPPEGLHAPSLDQPGLAPLLSPDQLDLAPFVSSDQPGLPPLVSSDQTGLALPVSSVGNPLACSVASISGTLPRNVISAPQAWAAAAGVFGAGASTTNPPVSAVLESKAGPAAQCVHPAPHWGPDVPFLPAPFEYLPLSVSAGLEEELQELLLRIRSSTAATQYNTSSVTAHIGAPECGDVHPSVVADAALVSHCSRASTWRNYSASAIGAPSRAHFCAEADTNTHLSHLQHNSTPTDIVSPHQQPCQQGSSGLGLLSGISSSVVGPCTPACSVTHRLEEMHHSFDSMFRSFRMPQQIASDYQDSTHMHAHQPSPVQFCKPFAVPSHQFKQVQEDDVLWPLVLQQQQEWQGQGLDRGRVQEEGWRQGPGWGQGHGQAEMQQLLGTISLQVAGCRPEELPHRMYNQLLQVVSTGDQHVLTSMMS